MEEGDIFFLCYSAAIISVRKGEQRSLTALSAGLSRWRQQVDCTVEYVVQVLCGFTPSVREGGGEQALGPDLTVGNSRLSARRTQK